MTEEYGSRESKRSKKKHTSFDESSYESLIEASNEPIISTENSDTLNKKSDLPGGLADMTEEEMAQHLKLCMKLSAENKINMKNAFGLHLIEIMQKMVNQSGKTDIQQASLSLYASSKIYAGRVEALYQDTCRFHGHLQSIVSGGKKEKKIAKNVDDENDMEDDMEDVSEKIKNKHSKNKCNSFLKSEEALSAAIDVNAIVTGEPHGNFVTIKSAFSTSRLAPKLLRCLRLVGDSCTLRCSISELNFKPKQMVISTSFVVSPKLEASLEKVKNFHVSQALLSAMEVISSPLMTTPKPPPMLFNDDEHFDAGCHDNSMMAPPDPLDSTIEKFDVLNITVDALVNDISAAVTNKGIDHNLLPPNSALKKMLDKSKRSSIKSVGKSTRTKKVKEPFFNRCIADDIRHLFAKGRSTTISQKILSEWNVENTSNIDSIFESMEDIESKSEQETTNLIINNVQNHFMDVVKQNDFQYNFKYYFNKETQLWKIHRRKLNLEQSYSCTPFGNQTEIRRIGSVAPNDPEGLALSFQNMSLHDSVHETPPHFEDEVSTHDIPALDGDNDEQQFLVPPEPFETDIEEMMVKPPELVRPTSMKFDQRPMNLNTEKIKYLLWSVISRSLEAKRNSDEFVLFSKVYEELKLKLERELSESISMQFTFVVLLILANEKTLLIENMEENTDLKIRQDISEIDVSQST